MSTQMDTSSAEGSAHASAAPQSASNPAPSSQPAAAAGHPPSSATPSSTNNNSHAQQPPSATALAYQAAVNGLRTRSLVMDLGGDTMKVGWAGMDEPLKLVPNCAVKHKRDTKWLLGDQMLPDVVYTQGLPGRPPQKQLVHKITDLSGLYVRRAHERGFVVNWELENQLWGRALHSSLLDPSKSLSASAASSLVEETSLLLTVPVCTPSLLAKDIDENVFEKWNFSKFRRITPAALAHRGMMKELYPEQPSAIANPANAASATPVTPVTPAPISTKEQLHRLCGLVVDSGYSFTHIMPVYQGKTLTHAVKRVNMGGKLLTNYLKELISYRAFNMMDETYIVNDIKEKLCYVSTNFERELQAAKKSRSVAEKIRREYVLPNGSTVLQGYVRESDSVVSDDDQVLLMGNERLAVPEVLFSPRDIGLDQMGIVEAIVASVEACPKWMQPLMYDNILLVGGNAKLPNFLTRIERELRPLVPQEFKIQCKLAKDPITSTFRGGSSLAYESHTGGANALDYVTKKEFEELGSEALTRRWEGDLDGEKEDEEMEQ